MPRRYSARLPDYRRAFQIYRRSGAEGRRDEISGGALAGRAAKGRRYLGRCRNCPRIDNPRCAAHFSRHVAQVAFRSRCVRRSHWADWPRYRHARTGLGRFEERVLNGARQMPGAGRGSAFGHAALPASLRCSRAAARAESHRRAGPVDEPPFRGNRTQHPARAQPGARPPPAEIRSFRVSAADCPAKATARRAGAADAARWAAQGNFLTTTPLRAVASRLLPT
jgi:hypothetical protein